MFTQKLFMNDYIKANVIIFPVATCVTWRNFYNNKLNDNGSQLIDFCHFYCLLTKYFKSCVYYGCWVLKLAFEHIVW